MEVGYSKHGNPYHNLLHAADVTQTVHHMLAKMGLVVSIHSRSVADEDVLHIATFAFCLPWISAAKENQYLQLLHFFEEIKE